MQLSIDLLEFSLVCDLISHGADVKYIDSNGNNHWHHLFSVFNNN